jgi:hypothetical protein
MSLISSLTNLFATQRISDRAALQHFMESRAAYLVQKSIMEYSQARANILFSTLLSEIQFQDAYERSRWLSYPAAFSMTAEMAEGYLREETESSPGALDQSLVEIGERVFAAYPLPADQPPDFWLIAADQLRRDLAQAALGPPKAVRNIPLQRAQEVFEALPVSREIRRHDFDMFQNTLRFHLTEIRVEFEEKADAYTLARALSG